MPLADNAGLTELSFQIVGGDIDQFHVIRYRGTEGLSQLFRFEIELVSVQPDMELDKIVGTSAILTIGGGADSRTFHGIVSRFDTTGEGPGVFHFRAEIVPRLWLLSHRYQCRIFQDKAADAILHEVLTSAGIAVDQFKFKLEGDRPPLEYCVQYRETDFNFMCRLMEEYGIYYFFEQTGKEHVLVMGDGQGACLPIAGDAALPYRPRGGMTSSEHVSRFQCSHVVRPGRVTLTDYNFQKPDLNLEVNSELGRDKGLEFSDYPGRYQEQARGKELARLRTEEFESGRISASGQSNCPRLSPGRTFELTEHLNSSLNNSYLITSITHEGKQPSSQASAYLSDLKRLLDPGTMQSLRSAQQDQNGHTRALAEAVLQIGGRLATRDPTDRRTLSAWLYHGGQIIRDAATAAQALGGRALAALAMPNLLRDSGGPGLVDDDTLVYQCSFECIPAEVSFRPPRITPWPVMRGSQTARVVGQAGEEIYTDEFGRVKVQFNWDRSGQFDDRSSCWVRVSQGSAGGAYGMFFLPRVGHEVIVDFLEGDPDQPIVIGRVYNKNTKPPYDLPGEKTKSVIKTHSSKGGGGTNEIRFEDAKDKEQLFIQAQKDLHVRVLKGEERHNVEKTQHLIVGEEYRAKVVKHRSVEVGGQDALHVKEKRNVIVDGDVLEEFKSNHGHKVASQYYINANELVVEATSGISFKVGGNFVVINSSGVFVKGSPIALNSGGSAVPKSVSGSPASPAAPEEADRADPGRDPTYRRSPTELPPIEPKPYEGHWISIDLKDEQGEPVPGEYYEISKPGGVKVCGTLDVNGFSRIWVDKPGQCQVCFPRMDAQEWQAG